MIEMFTGGCVLIRESVRLMEIKEGVIVALNLEGRVQISLGELRAKGIPGRGNGTGKKKNLRISGRAGGRVAQTQ